MTYEIGIGWLERGVKSARHIESNFALQPVLKFVVLQLTTHSSSA